MVRARVVGCERDVFIALLFKPKDGLPDPIVALSTSVPYAAICRRFKRLSAVTSRRVVFVPISASTLLTKWLSCTDEYVHQQLLPVYRNKHGRHEHSNFFGGRARTQMPSQLTEVKNYSKQAGKIKSPNNIAIYIYINYNNNSLLLLLNLGARRNKALTRCQRNVHAPVARGSASADGKDSQAQDCE